MCIRDRYERGALRAMLTGSGSAVFGVFADAASASACAAALSAVYPLSLIHISPKRRSASRSA